MSAKLISIIGPPAAGKTTVAEFLAQALPGRLVREDYAGNPFLADSYTGADEARLPGQLYFLLSRVNQLSLAHWPQTGLAVSDYGFCQDRIFAGARLSPDDLRAYEKVATRVEGLVKPPDLLICLDASELSLLARIAARGRRFEQTMDGQFLAAMRQAYVRAAQSATCPVIAVDSDDVDLRDPTQQKKLAAQVRAALAT